MIVNNSIADHSLTNLIKAPSQDIWEYFSVKLINSPDNIGFGRACNLGLEWVYAQAPQAIAWLINPDAYLPAGAIAKLWQLQQSHRNLSIIGTSVYDPKQRQYFVGGTFSPDTGLIQEEFGAIDVTDARESELIQANHNQAAEAVNNQIDWVSGCSLVINLAQFNHCPMFDPDYFLYYEDFDFCRRYVCQGHSMAIATQIHVIHQTSALTSANPGFKLKQEIYSYLLSLSKHAQKIALIYRLLRIFGVALLQIVVKPKVSIAKLQGVLLYARYSFLGNPSSASSIKNDR